MNYLTAPLMDGPSVQPDNALTGGQARRAWINALADRVGEYIPPELRGGVNMLSVLNPVNDLGEAMQSSRVMMDGSRSGRERFDAGVDMATNMAAVLAPVVAGKMAGGADEAADVVDALLGFGGPTREAATDYAKRFAGDEAGNIRLPIGDAVETRGSDILDLLRNGRAGEVTDEMLDLGDPTLNARLNEYLFNNYDLPMDEASRMARAREMGFDYVRRSQQQSSPFNDVSYAMFKEADVNIPDYAKRIDWAFEDIASYGEGQWLGRPDGYIDDYMVDAMKAIRKSGIHEDYGTTASALARGLNPDDIVDSAGSWDAMDVAGEVIDHLAGRDVGAVSTADGMIAWNPANIRSRFARFDPRLSHLRNLSAGAAGLGILGGAMTPADEVDAWLNGEGM